MKGFSGFKNSPAKTHNKVGSKPVVHNPKSPMKQEGPQTKENVDLMKGEMDGTYVYKCKDKSERMIDYEERAGFLLDNDIPDLEGSKDPKDIAKLKQLKKTAKNLQHEADIIRNRKPKK